MINIALVGYKRFPSGHEGDIIIWMPKALEERFRDICFHHVDVVEDRSGENISNLVGKMLNAKPDVLHYANYRDPYNESMIDQGYIEEVKKRSDIPILLTSGILDAETLANRLDIHYLYTPFRLKEYLNKLYELAEKSRNHQTLSLPITSKKPQS